MLVHVGRQCSVATPPLGCSEGIFTTAEALAGLFQFPGLCKQTGTWGDCPEAYKSHAKTWDKQISNNYREAFCLLQRPSQLQRETDKAPPFLCSPVTETTSISRRFVTRDQNRFKQLSSLSQSHSRRKKPEWENKALQKSRNHLPQHHRPHLSTLSLQCI